MNKITISVLVLTLLFIPGCKNLSDKAGDYVEAMDAQRDRIVQKLITLVHTFRRRDPGAMDRVLEDYQDTIDRAIIEVSRMSAFRGDTTVRDAHIELFELYLDVAGKEYKQMKDILARKGFISPTDRNKMKKMQEGIIEWEQELTLALDSAKEEFAGIYKFQIKESNYIKQFKKLRNLKNKR